MPKIMLSFSRDELNSMQYGIIVECWDKSMGSIRFKRKYREEFSEGERGLIREYVKKFHYWYLVKGTPEETSMTLRTWELLRRAVDFFATN